MEHSTATAMTHVTQCASTDYHQQMHSLYLSYASTPRPHSRHSGTQRTTTPRPRATTTTSTGRTHHFQPRNHQPQPPQQPHNHQLQPQPPQLGHAPTSHATTCNNDHNQRTTSKTNHHPNPCSTRPLHNTPTRRKTPAPKHTADTPRSN